MLRDIEGLQLWWKLKRLLPDKTANNIFDGFTQIRFLSLEFWGGDPKRDHCGQLWQVDGPNFRGASRRSELKHAKYHPEQ